MRSTSSAIPVAQLFIFTASILFLSTGGGFGSDNVPARVWPVSSPEAQGMDSEKLNSMLAETIGEKYHLDSVTIIRTGQIPLQQHLFGGNHRCSIYGCAHEKKTEYCGLCEQFPCDERHPYLEKNELLNKNAKAFLCP